MTNTSETSKQCRHNKVPEQCPLCVDAARKRKERAAVKEKKLAATMEAEAEWWSSNRALLAAPELEAMQAQDEICLDHILVMEYATQNNISLDDLNDIFEKDCVLDLVGFVKKNPCPHLGYISTNELPGDWSSAKYWQNPELLERLYAEGAATERYVKYGLFSGVSDFRVVEFLTKAGWVWSKAAALVGWHVDFEGRVSYPKER